MSIKQIPAPAAGAALPDFGSAGTLARIVLAVNALVVIVAFARTPAWSALPATLVDLAAVAEPPLVIVLMGLYLLRSALPRRGWVALAIALLVLVTTVTVTLALALEPDRRAILLPGGIGRALAWSLAASALVLYYLYLRGKALSPALAEARLMALTARIRPHFFFNSLNAVLGTMRVEPRRAESALEELAELFRAAMADGKQLSTLADEIALCRKYLDLEHLRLGERLKVRWQLEHCPEDALVPPLMLQPLLENAVYHGVEPSTRPTEISIRIERERDTVRIELANPYHDAPGHHAGNRMALANIRERLALFFDLEARLETDTRDGIYRVSIGFPYRRPAK